MIQRPFVSKRRTVVSFRSEWKLELLQHYHVIILAAYYICYVTNYITVSKLNNISLYHIPYVAEAGNSSPSTFIIGWAL